VYKGSLKSRITNVQVHALDHVQVSGPSVVRKSRATEELCYSYWGGVATVNGILAQQEKGDSWDVRWLPLTLSGL
jgi:hypothetical protein